MLNSSLGFQRFCVSALIVMSSVANEGQELKPPAQEIRVSAKPYTPEPPALRVKTDLVEVGVVVRGHDGHTIAGLKKENFHVTDQGRARDIAYFTIQATAAPAAAAKTAGEQPVTQAAVPAPVATTRPNAAERRSIALYFEDFGTNTGNLGQAKIAGRRFIQEGLEDGDRVALFSTSGNFLDYTNDKAALIAAIDKLRPHPKFAESGISSCPRISPFQAYQIVELFDGAALQAAEEEGKLCPQGAGVRDVRSQAEITWNQVRIASQVTFDAIDRAMQSLNHMLGQRVFLLVSAGFISGSFEARRDRLIDLALRSGIVVNALDARGLYAEPPGRPIDEPPTRPLPVATFRFETTSAGNKLYTYGQIMSDLAEATGGLFFHNNNDLTNGFRLAGATPEVSYMLGFHRRNDPADGKFHKLKVSLVNTKPYIVQARTGYFAPPKAAAAAPALTAREKLDREVTGTTTLKDIPITLTYRIAMAQAAAGAETVKAQVHIGIDKLKFPVRGERRMQHLTLVTALIDGNGSIVAAKEGTMDFALTDATYARLTASGINAALDLEALPGKYRLRAVVEEAGEGKMGSATAAVEGK